MPSSELHLFLVAECEQWCLHIIVSILWAVLNQRQGQPLLYCRYLAVDRLSRVCQFCSKTVTMLHGRTGSWLAPQGSERSQLIESRAAVQPKALGPVQTPSDSVIAMLFGTLYSHFFGNETRLMRSICCLYICVSPLRPGTRREGRCCQRFGKHVPAA
jgi:hypothetical protein